MNDVANDQLFILAFDHRASFTEQVFGIRGRMPTASERARLTDAKSLIWEGMQQALATGAPPACAGALVDEETGAAAARAAREAGVRLVIPVEKSGQEVFDFEYGEEFPDHIARFDPEFAKALVHWNPADDPALKGLQSGRARRLGEVLQDQGRRYLFELIVPPAPHQLALAGGSLDAYDRCLRPGLMLEAIFEIQEAGISPDAWKIEGLDDPADCALVGGLIRRDGRDCRGAVVLGRGAATARVEHWVRTAAGVPGYTGFAIGRTIWWDGVRGWLEGRLDRRDAAAAIGAAYRRFIDVYEGVRG